MSAVQRYRYLNNIVLGAQDVIALNHLQAPFNASIFVDSVSGKQSYSLEFTTDDLSVVAPNAQRWNPLPNTTPPLSGTLQYTLNFPVTGVRLNLAANDGEVRISVIQGIGLLR
jgi:hypothetical protein